MINQFKFKFTYDMYQATRIKVVRFPTREVPSKSKGGGSSDDNPKATITQQKQNK